LTGLKKLLTLKILLIKQDISLKKEVQLTNLIIKMLK
jgi:hypothetical protein